MHNATAYSLLQEARTHASNNMLTEAASSAEAAARLAADDIDIILEIAELLYDIKQPGKSVEILKAATTAIPVDAVLLLHLGNYLSQTGDRAGAIVTMAKAYSLDPANSAIYSTYANLLTTSGNIDEAIDTYTTALSHRPEDKGAWMSLASLKQLSGDTDGWLDAYKALHQLDPESSYFATILADALIKQERAEEAEAVLRNSIQENNSNINVHIRLADMLFKSGKHREALEVNRVALEIAPRNSGIRIQRAEIYERMGAFDDALDAIRELVETPAVTMSAALIFTKLSPFLGMREQARKLLSYIVNRDQLDPPPENVAKALDWLDKS